MKALIVLNVLLKVTCAASAFEPAQLSGSVGNPWICDSSVHVWPPVVAENGSAHAMHAIYATERASKRETGQAFATSSMKLPDLVRLLTQRDETDLTRKICLRGNHDVRSKQENESMALAQKGDEPNSMRRHHEEVSASRATLPILALEAKQQCSSDGMKESLIPVPAVQKVKLARSQMMLAPTRQLVIRAQPYVQLVNFLKKGLPEHAMHRQLRNALATWARQQSKMAP